MSDSEDAAGGVGVSCIFRLGLGFNLWELKDFFHTKLWSRIKENLIILYWFFPLFLVFLEGPFAIYLIFFTNFGILPFLYIAWLIYDKDTPSRGGRRWEFFRSLSIWNSFCDYFSMRLIKTKDLDPNKNYLFCSSPHGFLCTGIFGCFGTDARNVKEIFPNHKITILTLHAHCFFPIHREYLLLPGICSASRESMDFLLNPKNGKNAVILVPGGAPEMLDSHPNSIILHLKNRKGFIKVAIRNGSDLVPVFTFGETDIFQQMENPEGSWLRKCQNKMLKLTGLPFIVPVGSVFPKKVQLTVVVGAPIAVDQNTNPTQDDIDTLHSKFIEELSKLYYTHRESYAINSNIDIKIV